MIRDESRQCWVLADGTEVHDTEIALVNYPRASLPELILRVLRNRKQEQTT